MLSQVLKSLMEKLELEQRLAKDHMETAGIVATQAYYKGMITAFQLSVNLIRNEIIRQERSDK